MPSTLFDFYDVLEGIIVTRITICNLDGNVKKCLRMRAAEKFRSLEEEARLILSEVVSQVPENSKTSFNQNLDQWLVSTCCHRREK